MCMLIDKLHVFHAQFFENFGEKVLLIIWVMHLKFLSGKKLSKARILYKCMKIYQNLLTL